MKKIAAIGTIIGVLTGGIGLAKAVGFTPVMAGEFKQHEKESTEVLLEMRIDMMQDRVDRTKDPETKLYLQKRLDRYEEQLRDLQKMKNGG